MSQYQKILSNQQLDALAAIQVGLKRLASLAQRINTMNLENNLGLPSIKTAAYEAGNIYHQAEGKIFEHDCDMTKLRRHEGCAPDRLAA